MGTNARLLAAFDGKTGDGDCALGESSGYLRMIEAEGWYLDRTRGSHRQYRHAVRRGVVTVPGKPGDDLAPGTQNSILKQSGLK